MQTILDFLFSEILKLIKQIAVGRVWTEGNKEKREGGNVFFNSIKSEIPL